MKEAVLVHESNALHHLEHDVSDLGLWKGPTALETASSENGEEQPCLDRPANSTHEPASKNQKGKPSVAAERS